MNTITLIFLIFSAVLLLLPLYETLKIHNKTAKLFFIYFSIRIAVEFLGFSAAILKFSPHIFYHLFSLAEFLLLITIIKQIYFFKISFDIVRGFYVIIWASLHFFDLGELSENFTEPVGFSVWINSTFFITFCGFKLVNYNFKKGIKDQLMLLNLSILIYFLSVIFFILNKNYIYSSYMLQSAKIDAINEIIRWQAVFVSVSTIIYYFALKFMPDSNRKEEN